MSRSAMKVLVLLILATAGWGGLWLYEGRNTAGAQSTQAKAEAEQKTARLRRIADRLETDRRVARLIVTDQEPPPYPNTGLVVDVQRTTLLWMEHARDRTGLLPAKRFVLEGKAGQVTAKVVRFQGADAAENEPLAAHSLLLFKTIAGDAQTPALPIDPRGVVPDVYKGDDPLLAEVEKSHWQEFWKLAEDPQYSASRGVQVLDLQAAAPEGFQKGYIYTVILSADGHLHIRAEKAEAGELKAIEEGSRRTG